MYFREKQPWLIKYIIYPPSAATPAAQHLRQAAIALDNHDIYQTSLATVVLLSIANSLVYRLTLKRLWPLGLLSMPSLALADCLLAIKSMYSYEFGKVIWKERNICLPLFKVEKSLPKI